MLHVQKGEAWKPAHVNWMKISTFLRALVSLCRESFRFRRRNEFQQQRIEGIAAKRLPRITNPVCNRTFFLLFCDHQSSTSRTSSEKQSQRRNKATASVFRVYPTQLQRTEICPYPRTANSCNAGMPCTRSHQVNGLLRLRQRFSAPGIPDLSIPQSRQTMEITYPVKALSPGLLWLRSARLHAHGRCHTTHRSPRHWAL